MMAKEGLTDAPLRHAGPHALTLVSRPARLKLGLHAWVRTTGFGLAALIMTTLLARLLFADWLGLGIDESYVVAAGRHFHLGYFDHPPIVWWLAWAAGNLAGPDNDLVLRLPFILLCALSTWLMFRLATDLFDERAGFWAAAALNAAPVIGITAGTWVLPDGPLIAALLGGAVCLVRALPDRDHAWGWWLGTGACFGLAALSKYTAAPVGVGVIIYLLTERTARRWLARPHPYAAGLLAFAMFAPVLVWNAHHGWASLVFQGGRADGGRWHPFGPLLTLAGEAIVFLPWIWVPLMMCLWQATRRGTDDARNWLLACLSLPSVLLFELVSLRGHVLFHWAAPATMLALPLLGDAIGRHRQGSPLIRACIAMTVAIVTLGTLLVGTEVRFNWLPGVIEDFALGADPDFGAVDWTSLRTELARRGQLRPGAVVAATRWLDAGKIDFALRGEVPVICLGSDPREYGLASPAAAHVGEDVLIIAPKDTLRSLAARFGNDFDAVDTLPSVVIYHAGRPAMVLPVFLGHRLHLAAGST